MTGSDIRIADVRIFAVSLMGSKFMDESTIGVKFCGSLSYKEFTQFQDLLLAKWNKSYIVYPVTALLFTLFFSENELFSSIFEFIKQFVTWLSIFLIPVVLTLYMRKRAWRNLADTQGVISGNLSSHGITWKTLHSLTEYEWSEILKLKQSNSMLALFYSKRCAFYLPRSFFKTEEEWERAIDLCKSKMAAG